MLGSIIAILLTRNISDKYVADIYQNGILIQSIPLYEVTETYSFEVSSETGCSNVIEVRPGSISIRSANCPDKLCVHQGAISNTLLPITCLPNRVVIQLRRMEERNTLIPFGSGGDSGANNSITPDIVTH